MDGSHPVKLFRHGDRQAVDIPPELELPGDQAVMRREGDRLVIERVEKKQSLAEVLADLAAEGPLHESERMERIERQPPRPFEL